VLLGNRHIHCLLRWLQKSCWKNMEKQRQVITNYETRRKKQKS